MIYVDASNPKMKVAKFGFGSVSVCPTNNGNTMIANGVFLHDDVARPIGTKNSEEKGRDVRSFDVESILLSFENVESLDVLLNDLQIVRKGMLEGKSVDQVKEEKERCLFLIPNSDTHCRYSCGNDDFNDIKGSLCCSKCSKLDSCPNVCHKLIFGDE